MYSWVRNAWSCGELLLPSAFTWSITYACTMFQTSICTLTSLSFLCLFPSIMQCSTDTFRLDHIVRSCHQIWERKRIWRDDRMVWQILSLALVHPNWISSRIGQLCSVKFHRVVPRGEIQSWKESMERKDLRFDKSRIRHLELQLLVGDKREILLRTAPTPHITWSIIILQPSFEKFNRSFGRQQHYRSIRMSMLIWIRNRRSSQ